MEAAELAATRRRVAMVVPPSGVVLAPIADLRATPEDAAELVDQLHRAEPVRLLAGRDGWHYVQSDDHYFGWTRGESIAPTGGAGEGTVVTRTLARVHREPEARSEEIAVLPAGTPLPPRAALDDPPWIAVAVRIRAGSEGVARGYVAAADVVDIADLPHRAPTADDLVATAEAFIGVPYLWGGTTGLGLDCSGYVQQVYRLNGLRLDRDADQQAMEGRPVDRAARGDLVFFGERRVTHVALATGERTFLNAPRAGSRVERGEIGAGRSVLAIRRYLP